VTIFGEILPFGQYVMVLGEFFFEKYRPNDLGEICFKKYCPKFTKISFRFVLLFV
jgi:hypothetical protein